jgi:type II secretory pathway pseudopilin PulG
MNHTLRSKLDCREAGFTLIELLITLTITVAILTVVLTAVDLNANITRVQSDVSDVQQSTRVAQRDMQRIVRMVGRGGLPRAQAIVATQGVVGTQVGGKNALDETDVLTVRGTFTSPVFRIDASDPTTFSKVGNEATLLIDEVTRSAFDQPLDKLHDIEPGEAILLIGSQGEAVYAAVSLIEITFSDVTLDVQNQSRQVERATLKLSIASDPDGVLQITSAPTPGDFPANLDSVAFASVLEEYQFFVREDFAIPDDPTSRPSPKLARARMLPGTDDLHPDGVIDIADNVFDLQVAFGIDLDGNGRIDDENGATPLAASADEWRWNHVDDDPDDLAWDRSLQHVRLTIIGQAQTGDRQYVSPAMDSIENRVYDEDPAPEAEALADRRYRRRLLQSTIDLRNL